VYYYFPKLCTAIFRSCVFLIANFCALLFADHTYTPICDTPKVYVCYIIAEENPASTGHPIIPLSLMNEIRTAVNNRTESEHVKLKP